MNISAAISQLLSSALTGIVDQPQPYAEMVKPAQDPKHGDYQANCSMSLAKALGSSPRDVAARIVSQFDSGEMFAPPDIAGPGFINLRLKDSWIASQLHAMAADDRLGVVPAVQRTFVIDYSGPNVAKPLHVGHLRSTIIGDALVRLLRFLGHKVIGDNHLGDWGTQFGILIYGYKNFRDDQAFATDPVGELARLYVKVRTHFKGDEDDDAGNDPVQQACRDETAKLHAGDPENLALWKQFMPHCLEEIQSIYQRLGIVFDYQLGESFYHSMLGEVVKSLREQNIAVESEGAIAIFFGENETPSLVQKRDGAFTYTTSDLATIQYRIQQFAPDAILYVVDARQSLHFKNLFATARRWGQESADLEHLVFGSVLGLDRKPLKTRDGKVPLLHQLLNDAIAGAKDVFEKSLAEARERGEDVPQFSEEERQRIHEIVGIGAVKYADLSQNRSSDYVFDVKKMTATDGNTATYMQYAYARNRSIFRKGEVDVDALRANPPKILLETPHERALGLMLLRFHEALLAAAADYRPNLITAYLWDLSKTYSGFFQNCPVLKAATPELRASRLLLCDLTARVIQQGLSILGIGTIERM
jgi:arginyl-tRNA synthetase